MTHKKEGEEEEIYGRASERACGPFSTYSFRDGWSEGGTSRPRPASGPPPKLLGKSPNESEGGSLVFGGGSLPASS